MGAAAQAVELKPHPGLADCYLYREGINGGRGRYYVVAPLGAGYSVEYGYIAEPVRHLYRVNAGATYLTLEAAAQAIADDLDHRDATYRGDA